MYLLLKIARIAETAVATHIGAAENGVKLTSFLVIT